VPKSNRYKVKISIPGFEPQFCIEKIDWFEALDFPYDLSVPNVAHLEPHEAVAAQFFRFQWKDA